MQGAPGCFLDRFLKKCEEAHRLRGEVDALRREVSELESLREQNKELQLAIDSFVKQAEQAKKVSVFESLKEEEKNKAIQQLNELRQLGLAMIMKTDKNEGWWPNPGEFIEILLETNTSFVEFRPDNIELLFHGHMKDLELPARMIAAKQRDHSYSTASQKLYRTYLFADGHSEIKSANSIAELTAWENERIIPPELQSRRP